MTKLKRFLSLLTATAVAMSMMTTMAWAVEDDGINTLDELKAALAGSDSRITLTSDIDITESIYVERDVVIDGDGHTIDATGTSSEVTRDKQHGIVARFANVTLKNLTVSGAKGYGIQIASTSAQTLTLDNVIVKDSKKGGLLANVTDTTTNITGCTFTNNAWGDVEVVPTCTFSANSTSFNSNPAVWVDGRTVETLKADTSTAIDGDWLENYTATDVSKGEGESLVHSVLFVKNVDKDALTAAITAANERKNKAPKASLDGKDIYKGAPWITQGDLDIYIAAIATAQAVANKANATEVEVSGAITALEAATDVFKKAIKDGLKEATGARKTLLDTVNEANHKLRYVECSEDGKDVPANKRWATRPVINAYGDAIGTAQKVGLDDTKTDDDISFTNALKTLNDATVIFNGACAPGLMVAPPANPPSPSDNPANAPETVNKVEDTIESIADLDKVDTAKLPAGVKTETSASGATVAAIPVALSSSSADLGMDIFKAIGSNSKVALNMSISTGLSGSTLKILLPGGFGKITEPGRIGYSFEYKAKADNDTAMLGAVKTEGATNVTAKIGGNHTLPVKATFTVATKVADGKTVNIYKYNATTGKFVTIGTAKAEGGKLIFSTAEMGEILFTTGTI